MRLVCVQEDGLGNGISPSMEYMHFQRWPFISCQVRLYLKKIYAEIIIRLVLLIK